jgi:hypothetical protein
MGGKRTCEIVAEHLLLGLLADCTSVAAVALVRLSVDLDEHAERPRPAPDRRRA